MIPYLLYVALLLAVCWIFYKLLLHKETFYRLNRIILLGCLVISFGLPLIRIPQEWKLAQPAPKTYVTLTHVRITADYDTLKMDAATHKFVGPTGMQQMPPSAPAKTTAALPARPAFHISFSSIMAWLVIIYWAGVAIFALNLLIQLLVTLYQAYAQQAIIDHRYRIIDLQGDKIPCSFLNTIFINPEKYDWDTYNQILLHEKVHIRQLHSLDIFLAELTIIFQWFNPFAWLLRKEMENNLEYLTDEEVLNDNVEPSSYQMSLLKVSAPHLSLRITTNYNQSLLKKRIMMMNAKKSNIHILWKYFVLLPLFGGLACALNQPAVSKTLDPKSHAAPPQKQTTDTVPYAGTGSKIEGQWFATRKNGAMDMEFKTSTADHTWNSGGLFEKNEFSSIPEGKKGTFTVVRDAGTMVFNGSFDGDEGVGHFKFSPDKKYTAYLSTIESGKFDEHDVMSLMTINVSKAYLQQVADYGYINIPVNTFGSFKYFKVDAGDLHFWKYSGVKEVTAQDVLIAKIDKIDTSFVRSIQKLGYADITFQEVMSLYHEKITPEYIKGLQQAKQAGKSSNDAAVSKLEISDVLNAKFENLDSAYVRSIVAAGYNLSQQDLYQFKRAGITADYINNLKKLGYTPTFNQLLSCNSASVTPEFIKAYNDIGYNSIGLNELITMKYKDITPGYIKSFEALGYKSLPLVTAISFKLQNITPDYISGFNKLGFNNIPADDLVMLKMGGVTPEYVSSMKQKGLESKDLRKYLTLKNSFKDSE